MSHESMINEVRMRVGLPPLEERKQNLSPEWQMDMWNKVESVKTAAQAGWTGIRSLKNKRVELEKAIKRVGHTKESRFIVATLDSVGRDIDKMIGKLAKVEEATKAWERKRYELSSKG